MTPYRVELSDQAERDMEAAWLWISERSPSGATNWWNGLARTILALELHPLRHPKAPESAVFREDIRQAIYGRRNARYRILFTVRENRVIVLHVRHGARKVLGPAD